MLAPPATRISQEEASLPRDGITYTLKWDGYYHVLTATGHPSEDQALQFVDRAKAAVAWLLLQRGIAAEVDFTPQPIQYYPNPDEVGRNIARSFGGAFAGPVDTIIQGCQTALYPSEKRVRVETVFPAGVYTTIPIASALSLLVEGASFACSAAVATDEKLNVALALYGAFFTEQSPKARFLTLIMALEALATATSKSRLALELLAKWLAEIDELSRNESLSAEDLASLEALQRELLFRQEDSVRSQIRKLVRTTLAHAEDADAAARDAVRLYDLRSTLVHEGTLDHQVLSEGTSAARTLVHRTLTARFKALVGENTE
ncbi:MAG TPA: hypothetical protein VN283_04995 [Thiobacillus sp.]|nr:hypothetical protein [Thiobacillus sp.]